MTQTYAVDTESPRASGELVEEIHITVTVDDAGDISCNPLYISIPEKQSRTLIWTLNAPPNVMFDTPAITLFGEQPIMSPMTSSFNRRQMTWTNDEAVKGRSFSYTIHLLEETFNGIVPLTLDPIVHNEPPPAP